MRAILLRDAIGKRKLLLKLEKTIYATAQWEVIVM